MRREYIENWLSRLKNAWENQAPDEAAALFAKTKKYYERPFKPEKDFAAIRELWQEIIDVRDIKFDYEIVAVDENRVFVRWQNSYILSSNERENLDGVFQLDFNNNGDCEEFRMWWFKDMGSGE